MALVFVHGVNTRLTDGGHAESIRVRDTLFKESSMRSVEGAGTAVYNPYWGDLACAFPWDMAFLAGAAGLEAFGGAAGPQALGGVSLAEEAADNALYHHPHLGGPDDPLRDEPLLALARENFADAVDVLVQSAAPLPSAAVLASPEDVGRFGLRAAAYAEAHPAPPWLADVDSDAALLARLVREVETDDDDDETEALGAGDVLGRLKQGAQTFTNWIGDKTLSPVATRLTPAVLRRFSRFFGDVFVYLRQSWGNAQGIRERVEQDLRAASAALTPGEKLIVVAHSMGGNIVYDLLSSTAADLRCDLLLTVGSQVAMFEELKLFRSSDPGVPDASRKKVTPPANIVRWVNVFDPVDPFGYPAAGVFERVKDHSFDTRTSPLGAHGAYFLAPNFHRRLNARLPGLLT